MKKIFLLTILSLSFASVSQAADKPRSKATSPKMDWTSVQRENMAKMHEKGHEHMHDEY